MAAFDRDRPLWEATVVEGMEGGEAAFIVKLHHSLSDGVGAMRMLRLVADWQREPAHLGAMPPVPSDQTPDPLALITGAVGSIAGRAALLAWRGTETAIPAVIRSARDPIGQACGTVAMARSVYRTAAPNRSTLSPLMRERAMTRHLAMIEVPLDTLKRAAKIVDGTVNDAYLAAVTGGLRRYHERHHVAVGSLRALMPINLRSGADTNWGNKITLQRLTVPVAEPDPAARMRALHRTARQARAEPSLAVTGTIAGALNLLPVGYVAGILKHVDFLASNVPGVSVPVYLAGSKVTGIFAFGPTIGASVNTTLMSYNGSCDIGINIDTAAVPDPDVLLACLREGFAEITALGEGDPVPVPVPASYRADRPGGMVMVSPHRPVRVRGPGGSGHVQGRVAVEEPEWLEPERDDVAGYHRPSSGRVMWRMPNTYQSTTSAFSMGRFAAVQTGRPVSCSLRFGKSPQGQRSSSR